MRNFQTTFIPIWQDWRKFCNFFFRLFFKYTKNLLQKNPDFHRDSGINTNLGIFLDSLRA
jgi:hypothetical protein